MFGITKRLLPGLLVDSANYHPEKELFPEDNTIVSGMPRELGITGLRRLS